MSTLSFSSDHTEVTMGQLLSEPILSKSTTKTVTSNYIVGVSSMQGWRITMEDSHTILPNLPHNKGRGAYFGVFDGHGGRKVAEYASRFLHRYIVDSKEFDSGKIKTALEFAFVDLDNEMRKHKEIVDELSGSTAVIVLIKDDILYCANLGDSRAVACVNGETIALTEDHKPTTEKESERIIAGGGFIEAERVNGSLALSRAFGDYQFKSDSAKPPCQQIVSTCPDIVEKELDRSWRFLVVACDGIWEVLDNEEVINFVKAKLDRGVSPEIVCEQLMDRCVAPDASTGGPGCDNMTVIIVVFKWKVGDN